ncbi:transporter, partial [Methylobacterium sp. WL12]
MSLRTAIVAGLAAVTGLLAVSTAQAQTTTIPGEQVGLATGAPLPEGVYAINTFIYRRPDATFGADTAINIPV